MTPDPLSLRGLSVACAGAGSGIGRAAVDALVARGAHVTVLERDAAKCAALAADQPTVAVVAGDATLATANEALVAAATERFGGLDTAISFVGVYDGTTPLADVPAERFDAAFEEIFAVNVKSALHLARAALPALRARRGSLVLTLSSSSFYAGRGGTLYVAAKFALRGVIKQLAHEAAPDVRVNGVAPGTTVDTDLRSLASLGLEGRRLADRPGRIEEARARLPLGIAPTAADHAGAYLFLASRAAATMTGEILRSDGGVGVR